MPGKIRASNNGLVNAGGSQDVSFTVKEVHFSRITPYRTKYCRSLSTDTRLHTGSSTKIKNNQNYTSDTELSTAGVCPLTPDFTLEAPLK